MTPDARATDAMIAPMDLLQWATPTAAMITAIALLAPKVTDLSERRRLTASVENDLRIHEKLPDGAVRDRLLKSIEKRVVKLIIARGDATEAESLEIARAASRRGWLVSQIMSVSLWALALASALIVLSTISVENANGADASVDVMPRWGSVISLLLMIPFLIRATIPLVREVRVWRARRRAKSKASAVKTPS